MTTPEQLAAVEEIKILKARYFRYVDTKQWMAWSELFVEECSFVDLAGEFRCEGRAALREAVTSALDGVVSIHHGYMPEIDVVDEDHATGVWAMTDYLIYPPHKSFQSQEASTTVRGYGHYVERYVKADGAWRFGEVAVSRLHLEHHGTMVAVHPRVLQP